MIASKGMLIYIHFTLILNALFGEQECRGHWRNPEVWANLVGPRVGGRGKRRVQRVSGCLIKQLTLMIMVEPEAWAKLAGPRVGGGGKRKGTEGIGCLTNQLTLMVMVAAGA